MADQCHETVRCCNIPMEIGMPLIFRPFANSSQDDFDIVSGGLVIGTLVQEGVGREQRWRWSVYGIIAPATANMRLSGHAADLEQAKAAIADNWQKWLALAKLKEIE
jgi:hypothetical protein